ncbi:MAG: efflux RND transporter periplasmic adaptor subunit [Chthonomonas sp.]|nr:efflux RND transporter periplasmic adaptor subunit [Chthonomonas sp.]
MRKKWPWIVGLVVVGFVAFKSCGGKPPEKVKDETFTVKRAEISQRVIEAGTVDSTEVVEVKSQAGGRVAKLFVDEGDVVAKGALIALIDPRETKNKVDQDAANLRSAQAGAQRTSVEIQQRRVTAAAALMRARSRFTQLQIELEAQPTLVSAGVSEAQAALNSAIAARQALAGATQPTERAEAENAVREADTSLSVAEADLRRETELLRVGYTSKREQEAAADRVSQAKVRLQNAKDRVAALNAQQTSARRSADQQVEQARATLNRAMVNRNQTPLKRKELEQAMADVRTAEAGLRDVQALQASYAQSMASVDLSASALNESRRLLSETEIRAPIAGIVTSKKIKVGETVSALNSFSSGTAIVSIEDRTSMLVKIQINEVDVAKIDLGMSATITIDALPGKEFKGQVSKVAPASVTSAAAQLEKTAQGSDRAVVKYQVEVRMDDATAAVRSGMTAKCTILSKQVPSAFVVPPNYVVREGSKRFVMLGADAKTAKKTEVTLGIETGANVEVVTGLREGDVLVKPGFSGPARKGASFGPGD